MNDINNIETKAKNLLMRIGATEDTFANEDNIERFITSYILKSDKEFGKNLYGWGKGCTRWLLSKAPNKLYAIDNCVCTKEGLEYLKKLLIIKSGSLPISKKEKEGWIIFKKTRPAKDGWYIVLTSQKVPVDEYRYYRNSEITCSMYKDGRFSVNNIIAWRILPELDFSYESKLINESEEE